MKHPDLMMLYILTASRKASVGAALCFWLCTLGAILLAKAHEPTPDPFASYASILPGQPDDRAFAPPFVCQEGIAADERFEEDEVWYSCTAAPDVGPFAGIRVIVFDETIQLVEFTIRENALIAGDLALLWGRPAVMTPSYRWVSVNWPAERALAMVKTDQGQFSYLLPLEHVVWWKAANPH